MLPNGSNVTAIPGVIEVLQELKPKTMIDIGAGYGKYGMLAREYIKDLQHLDAIETEIYINYGETFYDHIYQDLPIHEDYDVALLAAVMCNFSHDAGRQYIRKIKKSCKNIVLTIERQQHGGKTQWLPGDFKYLSLRNLPYEWLLIL